MTRLLLIAAEPRESGKPVRRFHLGRLISEPRPLIDWGRNPGARALLEDAPCASLQPPLSPSSPSCSR